MNSVSSDAPSEEQERLSVLDMMANLGDRNIRPEAMKTQITSAEATLSAKLALGNPQHFETVGHALKRCGICLAFKAPIYATVAGLLTAGTQSYSKDFASKLADAVAKDLAHAIRDGNAGIARRALRFLACLACTSMVAPASVAEYIIVLLDAALFEMTSAERSPYGVHCRGEFLADIAMAALPWAGAMMLERANDELDKIMDTVREIAEVRLSGKWRCVASATDVRAIESFSALVECIFALEDANWVCPPDVIPAPYKEFDVRLGSGQEVVLSTLTIPGHSKLTRYSAPRFRLFLVNARPRRKVKQLVKEEVKVKVEASTNDENGKMHTKHNPAANDDHVIDVDNDDDDPQPNKTEPNAGDTDVPMDEKPKLLTTQNGPSQSPSKLEAEEESKPRKRTVIEKFVLRAYIADIVENFSQNHVMAAEKLLTIPMLKSADDEIVEELFSQLCSMPEPTFAPLYYGTLFVDLCRVKDSRLPIKLLTAVESMFQDAGQFDPEAFDRLTEWFSYHLSNFEYKWNWSDWALYADADMVDKFPFRALFCKDVLSRCIRLAYFERVIDIVPEEMALFLPPKPTQGDLSRFDENINENLMTVVTGKGRQDARVVKERLKALIPTQAHSDDPEEQRKAEEHANSLRLAALIRAILKAGCKTLSHFDTVQERYLSLLQEMVRVGGVPAKRLITLEASWFWKDVHIRRMYVLDKLSMTRVIDGLAIIDSILSEERPEGNSSVPLTDEELRNNLADSNCWEMLRLVMQRARAREEGARAELTAASQAAAAANEGETEKAESRLDRAKEGTENAKREIAELLLLSLRRLFALSARLAPEEMVMSEEDLGANPEEAARLPGFDGKPIWYWRCVGMIRELARKHPRHISGVIERLDEDTKAIREQHRPLWDSFEIIREVEGCALLPHVT